MLTLLILLLLRKAKNNPWLQNIRSVQGYRLPVLLVLLCLSTLIPAKAIAQTENLRYRIVQNDRNIGWIRIKKTSNGESTHIKLESEVKKRMIFLLTVIEKQEAEFRNGYMTQSYIYRKVNDDVKMNRHTSFTGNIYEVKDAGTMEKLTIGPVSCTQLSLYFSEPVNTARMYSDSFRRYLKIESKGDSVYKIQMPNGNCNYYFYEKGVCSRVRVEHDLFIIEFIRVN